MAQETKTEHLVACREYVYLMRFTNALGVVRHYISTSAMPTHRAGETHELIDAEVGKDRGEAYHRALATFGHLVEPPHDGYVAKSLPPLTFVKAYILRIVTGTGVDEKQRKVIAATNTVSLADGETSRVVAITVGDSYEEAKKAAEKYYPHWFK